MLGHLDRIKIHSDKYSVQNCLFFYLKKKSQTHVKRNLQVRCGGGNGCPPNRTGFVLFVHKNKNNNHSDHFPTRTNHIIVHISYTCQQPMPFSTFDPILKPLDDDVFIDMASFIMMTGSPVLL